MARVRDLWHKARPQPGDPECPEHRGKVATPRHGRGKRWLLVYRDPSGVERSEAFARRPDADKRLIEVLADVQRGDYVDPRRGRTTFAEVARAWLASRMVAAGTAERERTCVEGILIPAFGRYPVGELRPSMIREWMASRRRSDGRPVAASTLNLELWVLGSILRTAVDDGMIRRSPLHAVRRPRQQSRLLVPWNAETVARIVAAHHERVRPLPILGAAAGLRQSEALAVGVDDVDWLRRELRVERQLLWVSGRHAFGPPKRGSVGTVPLDADVVEILAAHVTKWEPLEVTLPWLAPDAAPNETRTVRLLVSTSRRQPFRRGVYNTYHWHPALVAAGITPAGKDTGFHQLRHFYASHLLAQGVPVVDVQARLRHRRLEETVRTYAHLMEDVDGAAADRTRQATLGLFRSVSVPSGSAVPSLFREI